MTCLHRYLFVVCCLLCNRISGNNFRIFTAPTGHPHVLRFINSYTCVKMFGIPTLSDSLRGWRFRGFNTQDFACELRYGEES
ncbi:hypothetical protein L873DRAFT_385191 [Choiromyces venosus 120613-1]|uniref:Secreted protein n=1 Tax=Choiromyces venosus 120613-1 TaxID=1336337 RepID=A0A3N4IY30_9PEZI|nr:hypothetical protein L873DRAFT_385191 [Choiromyces venosus 120613-1]